MSSHLPIDAFCVPAATGVRMLLKQLGCWLDRVHIRAHPRLPQTKEMHEAKCKADGRTHKPEQQTIAREVFHERRKGYTAQQIDAGNDDERKTSQWKPTYDASPR